MALTKKTLLDKYSTDIVYDEMLNDKFEVNPQWQKLLDNMRALGQEELINRQGDIDWYMSENGVTYNVYNDPQGLNRPWSLNVNPNIISAEEWETIEKGIQQRAHLFDLILKDIFGKRDLIRHGIVPQEVIYSHRGFIRQCDGIDYPHQRHLMVYGLDLARGPDGRMWVVSDRAQAPSGMGYALENRLTMGRVVPELFEGMNVKPISNFFNDFNDLLRNSSPRKIENPNIVILTPGPHNETYFEHAYLSTFLGYPLVQGADLLVRQGKLYMKSLKGLKQVDVVLRRVDDMYVDPLELREDSHLGVPGLLEVIRKKNVSVLNPIGSRIIENQGLSPFIPNIARFLLNEELILPQIAAWWCGQEKEQQYVLEHLAELKVRRIDRSRVNTLMEDDNFNEADRARITNKIHERSYRYVAQEFVNFSTTPVLIDGQLEPRDMLWRTFAVAKGDGYSVMPGGLVRVSPESGKRHVSNQSGGQSKDIWILSSQPEPDPSEFLISHAPIVTKRPIEDLPSLTAENLFWAGRYLGRSLTVARYLRMVLRQMNYSSAPSKWNSSKSLEIIFQSLTQLTSTYPGFLGEDPVDNPVEELFSVLLDDDRPGSLAHTLNMFSNSYYSIRNFWSADMWKLFDRIKELWAELNNDSRLTLRKVSSVLDRLVGQLIAFMGLVEESILVDQGLLMYFIGLQLEQSQMTVAKCRSLLLFDQEEFLEYEILESLLNSNDSLNIYRHSFRSFIEVENVIDLLLLDQKYPQSLSHRLMRLQKDFSRLPHAGNGAELTEYERSIFDSYSRIRLARASQLSKVDKEKGIRIELDEILSAISQNLFDTSVTFSNKYFSHSYKQNQKYSESGL